MNQYIIGSTIKELREKKGLTQGQFADMLSVTDKAVSKWETGKSYPDIALIEDIAKGLNITVTELLSGSPVTNSNISGNMNKSKFYVCPICGNIIHSMGETTLSCHGITLPPIEAEEEDEFHKIEIEKVEDEYFISIPHSMTKSHYISFIAAVTGDRLQLQKLYPEGNAQCRFKRQGLTTLYWYCNKDGLFKKRI